MTQTWSDLLFAHWPVSPAALRPLVPSGLEIDVYAGNAWVGVVPFCIPRLAPRGAPRRLGLAFPELNVRTYVTAEGKPGVWFFSLDAASALAVVVARATYHLPYFWARMRMGEDADAIDYTSRRRHPGSPSAEFAGRYWPSGPVFVSDPGSLEYFLTARYCLYAANRAGRLLRGEINHPPWPLQAANALIATNTMAAAHGIELAGPPLLHFARRIDMVAWWPERVSWACRRHSGSTRKRYPRPRSVRMWRGCSGSRSSFCRRRRM
jgi:uncharacterized protein YqjF (DUF2071 family)